MRKLSSKVEPLWKDPTSWNESSEVRVCFFPYKENTDIFIFLKNIYQPRNRYDCL